MPAYTLTLEDFKPIRNTTAEQVQQAIQKMADPKGPTYLILKDADGNYAQAGGTDGRYRIEAREVFGEGFRHWMAASPACQDRTETVVFYRNRCTENEHLPRRCPLNATVANVLSLQDVMAVMLEYWATGSCSRKYLWDDVSQSWIDREAQEKPEGIQVIKPKGKQGGEA
jgi:hypothetical protein